MREFVELFMGLVGYVAPEKNTPLSHVACVAQTLYDPNKKLPMMAPVLLDAQALQRSQQGREDSLLPDFLKDSGGSQLKAKLFFPPRSGFKAGYNVTVVSSKVHVMDPKALLDDHRVKTIDEFEPSKISKIAAFVKDTGVVTFRLEDPSAAMKFIKGVNQIKKAYKHSSYFGHNHPGNESPRSSCPEDKLVMFASFFDLPFAIPIYNRRRVDGMGIRIGMYWHDSSLATGKVYASDEVYAVVSNYPDNLLVVDGANINSPGFIGSEYVSHFCKVLEREKQRRKDLPDILAKAKKDAKRREAEMKKLKATMAKPSRRREGRMATINIDTSSATTWDSSTSTSYYYTNS